MSKNEKGEIIALFRFNEVLVILYTARGKSYLNYSLFIRKAASLMNDE